MDRRGSTNGKLRGQPRLRSKRPRSRTHALPALWRSHAACEPETTRIQAEATRHYEKLFRCQQRHSATLIHGDNRSVGGVCKPYLSTKQCQCVEYNDSRPKAHAPS